MRISGMRRMTAAAAVALTAASTGLAGMQVAQASPTWVRSRVVLVNCQGRATVRPRTFVLACADADDYLRGLHWQRWKPYAYGWGVERINSCVPNCASGKFHSYRVWVTLWRLRARPHHPRQWYYTRMTLHYTHRVPRGYHRYRVIALWANL